MSETPEQPTETLGAPTTPAGTATLERPQPVVVEEPRRHNRLYQVAAWVGIVAGAVFTVAVVFFSGYIIGWHAHPGGGQGHGHGHHHQWDGPPPGMQHHGPMGGWGPGGPGGPGGFGGPGGTPGPGNFGPGQLPGSGVPGNGGPGQPNR